MATTKGNGKGKGASTATASAEIKLPAKLPAIKGMTVAQVRKTYIAEREAGLGHVRVMARLGRRSRGEDVPALNQLRRFTEPVAATA